MNIVIDSNVIIAAFATRGLCASVFELCLDRYNIIISNHILSEVSKALHKKIKLPGGKIALINNFLNESCVISEYEEGLVGVYRDNDDNKILALCFKNIVDYIVTGDEDLLIIKKFNDTMIVNPRQFWEIVRKGK